MCGQFARSLPHVKSLARVAARRDAHSLDWPENAAQAMHVGAGAEDPRRLVGFVNVRIGLEMGDQLGVDVDRVADAPVAERLRPLNNLRPINDRWRVDDRLRISAAP